MPTLHVGPKNHGCNSIRGCPLPRTRRTPPGHPVRGGQEGFTDGTAGLALASLETRILLVDHEDLAVAADNLGARLVLQRPKGLTDLHRALLSRRAPRAAHTEPRRGIDRD